MSHACAPDRFKDDNKVQENALDECVAPYLRLWMLLAMVLGVLLAMTIVICCLIRIRIPRTKREIEMNTARRKTKKPLPRPAPSSTSVDLVAYHAERTSKVIVMSSLPTAGSLLPPPSDIETNSCTSCETNEDNGNPSPNRDPSPSFVGKNNINKNTSNTSV